MIGKYGTNISNEDISEISYYSPDASLMFLEPKVKKRRIKRLCE